MNRVVCQEVHLKEEEKKKKGKEKIKEKRKERKKTRKDRTRQDLLVWWAASTEW